VIRRETITVHSPVEAAKILGNIGIPALIRLLREGAYSYVALTPGARPWEAKGRRAWGLTTEQINEIIRGQTRRHPRPVADEAEQATAKAGLAVHGWDGVDRLGTGKRKRMA
jgi:hypothetical protein